MEDKLYLHVPELDELWFRQEMLGDPATMDYNRGYDLDFAGYHPDTGCIDFPREKWEAWYADWVGREPDRYYAYVVRESDGAFLGEVNLHKAPNGDWYEIGIVLHSRYRGMDYSGPALRLLLDHAFRDLGAETVYNDFEETRGAAFYIHLAAGFRARRVHNGITELALTRQQYESLA